MAISFPITLPTSPGYTLSRWGLISHTTIHKSALNNTEQVLERAGQMWAAQLTLPPMLRPVAAAWVAKFISLRGRFGTFFVVNPDAKLARGTVSSLTVNGAGQAGHTLAVTMTGTLLAMDFIELNTAGRLHMVVEDQSGSGNLEIEPALRESPSGAIAFDNARVKVRLVADRYDWNVDQLSRFGLSVACVEAL